MEIAPIITHCCHCRLCQQATGAPFNAVAMIETRHLLVTDGKLSHFQGVKNHKRAHCADCGCVLWVHRQDLGDVLAFVGVGVFDQTDRLQPDAHYFIRSKHPWVTLPPDVPAFEELGDPGKAGVRERIVAALAVR